MQCLIGLAVVFLAGPASAAAQDVAAHETAPVELRAECTLTVECLDRIVALLTVDSRSKEARAVLAEHAAEHGWSTEILGPDFIEAGRGVPCSDDVLERMAASRSYDQVTPLWKSLEGPFAISLQRAQRLPQALELLDDEIAMSAGYDSSSCETAAALCARDGQIARALKYAEHWTTSSGCSIGFAIEDSTIKTFRVRQLLKLGRHDEAIAIGREMVRDEWRLPDATMIALCIDGEIGSRRCADSVCATTSLLSTFGSDATHIELLPAGKRLWDLQHAPRAVQLANLSEIASLDHELALSLVFGFDNHIVDEHLDAFDVVDGKLRDQSLAYTLACTGNTVLQFALDRAGQALGEDVESERKRWNAAHARWIALSRPRGDARAGH